MINNYSFRYDELTLDFIEITRVLGYEGQPLPEPFLSYFELVSEDCKNLDDISGSYCIAEHCIVEPASTKVVANNFEFKVGRTIGKELSGSANLAFFICTAGKAISSISERLFKGEDPVLGYVYDVFGSAIAEAVADKIQGIIEHEVQKSGNKITNRYSPGYCHWNVSDQAKLFSLFSGSASGVTLTPSFLMNPIKSVSGVIGIGKDVISNDYQCTLCTQQNCVYRDKNRM